MIILVKRGWRPADTCIEEANGSFRTDGFKTFTRSVVHGASSESCIGAERLGRAVQSGSGH